MKEEIESLIKKSSEIQITWLYNHYDQYHIFFIGRNNEDIGDFIWYSNYLNHFHSKLMEIGFRPEFDYGKHTITYKPSA